MHIIPHEPTHIHISKGDHDEIRIILYRDNQLEDQTSLSMQNMRSLSLSKDGNFLLALSSGTLRGFLINDSSPSASYRRDIAVLSSHKELSIVNKGREVHHLRLDHDPDVIGLGPYHVAISSSCEIYIYDRYDDAAFTKATKVLQVMEYVKVWTA